MFTIAEKQFLELYKMGVWNTTISVELFKKKVDWKHISELATMQTMNGIITHSVSKMPSDLRPQASIYFNMLAQTQHIIAENKKMNEVFRELYHKCEELGLQVFLLKGQSVAQYYPDPLLRTSGDIDLFFPDKDHYEKAKTQLYSALNGGVIHEDVNRKHAHFMYKNILVELHGSIHGAINVKSSKYTQTWVDNCFLTQQPLKGKMADDEMLFPSPNFDALFIFIHYVRHYFSSAVGLRQITDWMLYYKAQKHNINEKELLSDLHKLGLTKVWSVFSTMVVNHLGCPKNIIPLYNEKYSKEAATVLRFILDSGNFGYYDKRAQTNSKNKIIQKMVALNGHLKMQIRNFKMFPQESVFNIPSFFKDGFERFFKGLNKHKKSGK